MPELCQSTNVFLTNFDSILVLVALFWYFYAQAVTVCLTFYQS